MKIIQVLRDIKSRPVTDEDIRTVSTASKEMVRLCRERVGRYNGAAALAHVQVEYSDPLRFYVLADGTVIINPEIIRHTRHTVENEEGCMSYGHRPPTTVERWNKVVIKYQELCYNDAPTEQKLSEIKTKKLSRHEAFIAQHEISHLNGITIYSDTVK